MKCDRVDRCACDLYERTTDWVIYWCGNRTECPPSSDQSDHQSKETVKIMSTIPVTTLHVALYGVDADDGRLTDLIDRIDRWADDNLGEEPAHSRDTHYVSVRHE